MIEGFSLGHYLLLADYTGRLFRAGKARISNHLAEIPEEKRGREEKSGGEKEEKRGRRRKGVGSRSAL